MNILDLPEDIQIKILEESNVSTMILSDTCYKWFKLTPFINNSKFIYEYIISQEILCYCIDKGLEINRSLISKLIKYAKYSIPKYIINTYINYIKKQKMLENYYFVARYLNILLTGNGLYGINFAT